MVSLSGLYIVWNIMKYFLYIISSVYKFIREYKKNYRKYYYNDWSDVFRECGFHMQNTEYKFVAQTRKSSLFSEESFLRYTYFQELERNKITQLIKK